MEAITNYPRPVGGGCSRRSLQRDRAAQSQTAPSLSGGQRWTLGVSPAPAVTVFHDTRSSIDQCQGSDLHSSGQQAWCMAGTGLVSRIGETVTQAFLVPFKSSIMRCIIVGQCARLFVCVRPPQRCAQNSGSTQGSKSGCCLRGETDDVKKSLTDSVTAGSAPSRRCGYCFKVAPALNAGPKCPLSVP